MAHESQLTTGYILFCERKGMLPWIKGVCGPLCFEGVTKMTGFLHETVQDLNLQWIYSLNKIKSAGKWLASAHPLVKLPRSSTSDVLDCLFGFWQRSDNIFRCFLKEINSSQSPFNQKKQWAWGVQGKFN